ncbi:MAG: hypothetical protein NC400_13170 [Clostridium sp.]|nr:hypothetical protein [Clostridium sp.]
MSTSIFDRNLEITDMESLKNLIEVMNSDPPPISNHPFSEADLRKGEELVRQWFSNLEL